MQSYFEGKSKEFVSANLYETIACDGKNVQQSSSDELHFVNNGSAVCRICHGSELSSPTKGEPLLSLCKCRGTMGLFHPSCLETWLSTSNSDKCEICHYQFATERHPKCVTQFIKSPGSPLVVRNMISDFMCFLILTPLAISSIWLCISGALYYGNYSATAVEVSGLICLATFLLLTYFIWLLVTLRYHCKIYHSWQEKNQNVKIHLVRKTAPSSPLRPSAEILSSNSVRHDVNNNFIYSAHALQNSV
ncbi:E3 ubiquitin-protein ligase [Trichinella pseudospiralis]